MNEDMARGVEVSVGAVVSPLVGMVQVVSVSARFSTQAYYCDWANVSKNILQLSDPSPQGYYTIFLLPRSVGINGTSHTSTKTWYESTIKYKNGINGA
jgi:hypothetical protein